MEQRQMKTSTLFPHIVGVLFLAALAHQIEAGPATIDVKTWHQKISGFGCSTAWSGTMTPTEADELWDTVKGAGLSLNRVMIDRDGLESDETNNAISATSRGCKVWGTPWYCKNGVNVGNYDTLYEKDYQEWANTLATMANTMKAKGAPIYAISSGNEIDLGWTKFGQSALALYVGKYLGPTLAKQAPDTKVLGIETCNWYGFDGYENTFKNDADAWKYSSILATHEYGGDPKAYPEIQAAGKEFWETEIYDPVTDQGEDVGMGSALRVCKLIHEALTIANMNAWHYWWKNPCTGCANGALWSASPNAPTKRLWIMGNYSKYVRPGFIRVEAPVEPTSGVLLTAFRDTALSKVVIVAANNNNNDVSQSFSIPGAIPSKVTPIITDPTRDIVVQASQNLTSGDFTYSLPSQSVTTLVFDMGVPVPAHRDSVYNGTFNFGTSGWTFNTWEGGAHGSVVNGEYQIQIDSVGQHNSGIQLVQNGIILEQGRSYEVKFDAYASANRTLEANVEQDVSPWTSYLSALQNFDLTTSKTTYSYVFTMTMPTDSNSRVSFNAGASTESIFLDNISIQAIPTSIHPTSNLKTSGTVVRLAHSRVEVEFSASQGSAISLGIFDLNGTMVRGGALRAGSGQIQSWTSDLSGLPRGVYVLGIDVGGKAIHRSTLLYGD
jgi:glucuronoarabinoxylan endo-1,4-beta-xylanase